MKKYLFALLMLFVANSGYPQKSNEKKKQFFIEAGYGLAGSFSVASYSEFTPIPQNRNFANKNFIGTAQNVSVGIKLNQNWQIKVGLHYQYFKKWVKSSDTFNTVIVNINRDIHEKNFLWYGVVDKRMSIKKNSFLIGLGIYYIESKAQSIEIYPRYVLDIERIWKGAYNGDAGVFTEIAYEYKFQPKVYLGIKSQFYFTATLGTAESITLFPYVVLKF